MVNRSKEFAYKMRFEDSGLHLISIIIYLGQKNTLDDLCVQESTKILAKAFYDICVKIGYHDKDIGYVLAENKWPF